MGHKSEDSFTSPLQEILRTVRDLKGLTAKSHSLSQSPKVVASNARPVLDSVNLPSPDPLLPALLESGLSLEISSAISNAYQFRAEELKRRVQESIITACRETGELPAATLASSPDLFMRQVVFTFTEVYSRRLEQWKQEIIKRVKQVPTVLAKAVPKDSSTFNHDYVPLLECFFKENPFPTHADKVFLAKKSNMQYKQIHVWFQNRRSRTRKEGKLLRKTPPGEATIKPLDKSCGYMKHHITCSGSQVPKPSRTVWSKEVGKIGFARVNVSEDSFASLSPPHAFPSSYPPTCHYNPFPCKSGSSQLSDPKWRRVPHGKLPAPRSTDMNELIEMFSCLNVRGEDRSKSNSQSHAATAAITVVPSWAPHPSLIVRKPLQPANVEQQQPSIGLRIHRKSSCPSSEHLREWKAAPLPERLLSRIQTARRDTTPSEDFSTSFPSPRLFTPVIETRTYSLSLVSSASTPTASTRSQTQTRLFDSPQGVHSILVS